MALRTRPFFALSRGLRTQLKYDNAPRQDHTESSETPVTRIPALSSPRHVSS